MPKARPGAYRVGHDMGHNDASFVSNSLPTGYTSEVHQFLAQNFDYGRNLVVVDLLAVKQSHCGFMVLLCNEAERTRVENSKVLAVDGNT